MAFQTLKIEVPFPLAGMNVERPAHAQPPLTTRDAFNVWAFDGNGRSRGCQRPGLTALWTAPSAGITAGTGVTWASGNADVAVGAGDGDFDPDV